ncbi:membrane fusion protein, cobalt-zinc-cadmium efflux system [Chryseolinea serpens]|uniref:Membrane fusion protein, cobalt-zinc-cadmium efflux system n=1 Tax=Chryseolinea serpens TaxID=947013 RepID=A0A1M5TFK5_9BACT|nr:efflux RND transporter periplasmic adaptor subunit [Chryseolinea serpens]SHH49522.1 membrane fusion protein, cobalt-zinc-cadmium efflux system [Chryseolinea serpens]
MKNSIMPWVKISIKNCPWMPLVWSVVLLAVGCDPKKAVDPAENKAFALSDTMLKSIKLDTVAVRPVNGTLNLNGKIVADENRLVEIFPIVGGNVVEVDAELGDYVKKNQTLATIKSGEVAEYDRQLIEAQSDVLVAQKNLSVKQDLYDSKLSSDRELVAAQKELEKAEAALRRITETFSIYNFNKKSEYSLKAPINGFVIYKNLTRDMTLPAGHTESVFTVAELDEVWAIADVYESDISRIREGMDVCVTTLSYPGDLIRGKIDKIFSVLDPETKTMKVRIRIPNPQFKLKPQMLATIKATYHEDKSMTAVPSSAIIFDNSRQFVMIFKDRFNIDTREVEVYKTDEDITWITQGVKPGEVVISHNQLFIYDALND